MATSFARVTPLIPPPPVREKLAALYAAARELPPIPSAVRPHHAPQAEAVRAGLLMFLRRQHQLGYRHYLLKLPEYHRMAYRALAASALFPPDDGHDHLRLLNAVLYRLPPSYTVRDARPPDKAPSQTLPPNRLIFAFHGQPELPLRQAARGRE